MRLSFLILVLVGCSEPAPTVTKPELDSAVKEQELINFAHEQREAIKKEIGRQHYRTAQDILKRYPRLVEIQNGSGGNAQEFLASCQKQIEARDRLNAIRMETQRRALELQERARNLDVPAPIR